MMFKLFFMFLGIIFFVFTFLVPFSAYEINSFEKFLLCLPDLRNYFWVLSSVSGMATGGIGIFLGYYYFKRKKEIEDESELENRKRNRFEFIFNELMLYDSFIDKIISNNISDQNELNLTRHKVRRSFENIEAMLEKNETILKLEDYETGILIKVNSFVDKCEPIMNFSYGESLEYNYEDIIQTYISLIREAKILCFSKTE